MIDPMFDPTTGSLLEPVDVFRCPNCSGSQFEYSSSFLGFSVGYVSNYQPCKRCLGSGIISFPKEKT
jgi:DnaJ-class molecular chaperone